MFQLQTRAVTLDGEHFCGLDVFSKKEKKRKEKKKRTGLLSRHLGKGGRLPLCRRVSPVGQSPTRTALSAGVVRQVSASVDGNAEGLHAQARHAAVLPCGTVHEPLRCLAAGCLGVLLNSVGIALMSSVVMASLGWSERLEAPPKLRSLFGRRT